MEQHFNLHCRPPAQLRSRWHHCKYKQNKHLAWVSLKSLGQALVEKESVCRPKKRRRLSHYAGLAHSEEAGRANIKMLIEMDA
jgi:hypothetical protein